jgi:hypothetical protein
MANRQPGAGAGAAAAPSSSSNNKLIPYTNNFDPREHLQGGPRSYMSTHYFMFPEGATNVISYDEIMPGDQLVNFKNEHKYGRYYKWNTYSKLQKNARTGEVIHPFTKQRIKQSNITLYNAVTPDDFVFESLKRNNPTKFSAFASLYDFYYDLYYSVDGKINIPTEQEIELIKNSGELKFLKEFPELLDFIKTKYTQYEKDLEEAKQSPNTSEAKIKTLQMNLFNDIQREILKTIEKLIGPKFASAMEGGSRKKTRKYRKFKKSRKQKKSRRN